MGILDALHTGLSELLSHKMRSMLTMLGVIFGVAAVIAMVSIGEGAKQEALDQIRLMGTNVVHIKRGAITGELADRAEERSPYGLKLSDTDGLRGICSFARRIVPVREVFANVKVGEKPVAVKVVGTEPDYLPITRSVVAQGRFLDWHDVHERLLVCVLGSEAKRELFGFSHAVGKTVKISSDVFRVVGVMQPKDIGSAKAVSALRDLNSDIYIPITSSVINFNVASQQVVPSDPVKMRELGHKMRSRPSTPNSGLTEIIMEVESDEAAVPAADVIRSIMDRQHRGIRDYEIIIPAELLRQSQQTQRIFNIVMAAIASISLLVGGIGIMNIMLATVTQRTREIGVRRCVGATRWDIIRQFMLEAMVITCAGGLIGVALGIGGASAITTFAGWRTVVSMQAVIVSFSVSALVGVVFGLYPAVRAAMVDPIEALRYG
jgi:putative ABC transport system permease protein